MFIKNQKSGFGLVEIIIGVAIISASLFSLAAVSQISLRLAQTSRQNIKAGFLLEEGVEAVKFLRDAGWDTNIASLTAGVPYYLNFNGTSWESTYVNSYIDGVFERSFVIEDVYRDANDDIAESGDFDLNTKKISVFVSWETPTGTMTKSISTYITNIFNN